MPWRTAPPAQNVSAHRGGSGRGDPIALRTCFLHGKGNKFPGQKGFYPVTLLFFRLYSVNSRPLRRLLADSRPAAHWLDKRSAGPQSVPPSPVGTFLCRTMALQAAKTLSSARSSRVGRFPIPFRLPQREAGKPSSTALAAQKRGQTAGDTEERRRRFLFPAIVCTDFFRNMQPSFFQ